MGEVNIELQAKLTEVEFLYLLYWSLISSLSLNFRIAQLKLKIL